MFLRDFRLDAVKMYMCTKSEVRRSRLSKVRAQIWQTDTLFAAVTCGLDVYLTWIFCRCRGIQKPKFVCQSFRAWTGQTYKHTHRDTNRRNRMHYHCRQSTFTSECVGLTSHSTHNRSFRGRFLQARWPNQQCQSTEGNQLVVKDQAWIPPEPLHHVTIIQL